MNEQGVVDFTFLQVYAAGNSTLMKNFIQSFLDKTPLALQQIETHLSTRDFHSLSGTAHQLKPQLSYMGIKSAHEIIAGIEDAAKNEIGTENIAPALNSLKEILESAYAELKSKLNEL